MNIRTVLLGLVGTAMLSSAALAATGAGTNTENHPANRQEMADRCTTLESQYQSAITSHANAAQLDQAEDLGSIGTTECQSNQGSVGVHKLEQALSDLGIQPVD